MRAGQLRHRVEIHRPAETENAIGEVVSGYELVCSAWAAIEDLNGSELLRAQQIAADASILVRMRHRNDLTTKHILKRGARTLEIVHIGDLEGRSRELHLFCKESR